MALSTSSCLLRATQFAQTLDKSTTGVLSSFRFPNTAPISRPLGPPRLLRHPSFPMPAPVAASSSSGCRIAEVKRATKETDVYVKINLDGSGVSDSNTGIPFLDHMLDQLASHGLFDLHVKASGGIHIDDHYTDEDVALAIGTALLQALGDRKGIQHSGHFAVPLDEAAIEVILDSSGRPHLSYDLCIPTERVEHFFQSLANTSGMRLHIRQLAGKNWHHIIEATFKAFARALRQATEYDFRRGGSIPRFAALYGFSKKGRTFREWRSDRLR